MATEELAGVAEESPELGKTTQSTSDSRDRAHHSIELAREPPGWCPFAPEVHGFAGKARRKFAGILVDAKVRREFVGARVIETERGWAALERGHRGDQRELFIGQDRVRLFSLFSNFGN
jgi:hypothetical protein